jgi:hypothetical protein
MGLPNKFGCRQPPAVVEEPLIVLQVFAPRNPASKLMLTILGGVGARHQAGEAARAQQRHWCLRSGHMISPELRYGLGMSALGSQGE